MIIFIAAECYTQRADTARAVAIECEIVVGVNVLAVAAVIAKQNDISPTTCTTVRVLPFRSAPYVR